MKHWTATFPPGLTDNHLPPRENWSRHWAFLLALAIFLQSVVMATHIRLGSPPDELAHISYVKDAIASDYFLPDYAHGKIINSMQLNYMGHPPLYYASLAIFARVFELDPIEDYKALRVLSGIFVAVGFLLWLWTARNLGMGLFPAIAVMIASCATPMFSYLAGSINNDTLAYLGVALFFVGVSRSRMEPGGIDFLSGFCLAGGLTIALLTKATAAAFLFFFIVVFALLRFRTVPRLLRDRTFLTAMAAVIGVCGLYYAYTWGSFGSPFPKPRSLYPHSPPANPLGLYEYTLKYISSMWERLPVIVSHAPISPFPQVTRYIFYTMLVAPLLGWIIARRGAKARSVDQFTLAATDAFMAAVLMTVVVHVYYVYNSYLENGLFAGWQPRYYFFALPFVWIPFFAVRPPLGYRAIVSAVFVTCGTIAFWASVPMILAEQAQASARKAAAALPSGTTIRMPPETGKEPISLDFSPGAEPLGHVDELQILDGTLLVTGWAFNKSASGSPTRVWIFADGRYLGATPPQLDRPDVAKALSKPEARSSGFRISIAGLPADIHECEVQVASELPDGSLAIMRKRTCVEGSSLEE